MSFLPAVPDAAWRPAGVRSFVRDVVSGNTPSLSERAVSGNGECQRASNAHLKDLPILDGAPWNRTGVKLSAVLRVPALLQAASVLMRRTP